jgi:ketosteroid isomerase-like protein
VLLSWFVGKIVRRQVDALNRGDVRPLVRSFAKDAVLRFPGANSWAGEYRGRAAIEGFVRRFHDTGLRLHIVDVTAKGSPWNMTAAVHFTDHLTTPAGERVYENRGVLYVRSKWGKVTAQDDFLDTQAVAELDSRLAADGKFPA